MQRKIVHIDMDAFFASVEQLDNPALRGRPIVVGSDSDRGVVAAASYEARKYGVRSAMPSRVAKKLCPGLIFVKHRMGRYKEVSNRIFDIFYDYTPIVEALSVDEAFLEFTDKVSGFKDLTDMANRIKSEIKAKTGLTCSAGISVNKFLAKIASDMDKPDGLYIIYPDQIDEFVDNMSISDFYGIGKVTAEKMHRFGIHTGADLKKTDKSFLDRNFGKAGSFFYDIARGIDSREVDPGRIRKSVGAELTFERDLISDFEIITELYKIEKTLWSRVQKHGKSGRTITVKVKYDDFSQITRSLTLDKPVDSFEVLHSETTKLRKQIDFNRKRVRLLGVIISNLTDEHSRDEQLRFW